MNYGLISVCNSKFWALIDGFWTVVMDLIEAFIIDCRPAINYRSSVLLERHAFDKWFFGLPDDFWKKSCG